MRRGCTSATIMAALRRLASENRTVVHQPIVALLENPDLLKVIGWEGLGFQVSARSPMRHWQEWGTLCNRKVEVRNSEVGEDAGRGLFAGANGRGFTKNQVITLYGGRLLTRKQMEETEDHSYMMRVTNSGQGKQSKTVMFVDGKQFAAGLSDADTHGYFQPPPGDSRFHQGAGSLANDSRGPRAANARLDFMFLDKQQVLPQVPVLVAKRQIAPGEEILFDYGTDKPHLFEPPLKPTAKRARSESPIDSQPEEPSQDAMTTAGSAPGGHEATTSAGLASTAEVTPAPSGVAPPEDQPAYGSLGTEDDEPCYRSLSDTAASAAMPQHAGVDEDTVADEELLARLEQMRFGR